MHGAGATQLLVYGRIYGPHRLRARSDALSSALILSNVVDSEVTPV